MNEERIASIEERPASGLELRLCTLQIHSTQCRSAFRAVARKLWGEHVRDMMVQAVEHRFGAETRKLSTAIEWLSDNGSIYTSDETREFGAAIDFVMCTTPPYSPESNGMAESFVKSFKRDYVYLADLWTAGDVLRDLLRWFDDYNRVRPPQRPAHALTG